MNAQPEFEDASTVKTPNEPISVVETDNHTAIDDTAAESAVEWIPPLADLNMSPSDSELQRLLQELQQHNFDLQQQLQQQNLMHQQETAELRKQLVSLEGRGSASEGGEGGTLRAKVSPL